MKFLKFLISKAFAIYLAIILAILALLLVMTFYTLSVYTDHGVEYEVPDFKGMSLDEVDKLCNEKNLTYKVLDSAYVKSVEKGAVYDQSPVEGFKVKEGRTIFLTLNATMAERTIMPNLIDVSLRQATSDAESYDLKIGKLQYIPSLYSTVIKQLYNGKEIAEGEMVEKGAFIDLVIGRVGNEKTLIPNLLNMSLDSALVKLTSSNLNIGLSAMDETVVTSGDSINAKIWKQDPMPVKDAKIILGGEINVWLTIDEELIPKIDSTFNEYIDTLLIHNDTTANN